MTLFLSEMEKRGLISAYNNKWNIAGYQPVLTQVQQEMIKEVETLVMQSGLEGVYEDELFEKCTTVRTNNELFIAILNRLMETKAIYRRDKIVFHAHKIAHAKTILHTYLTAHTEGIKVSEFRELLGTNRKIAMIYLDIIEELGFIYREGDYRFLTINESLGDFLTQQDLATRRNTT